MLDVYSQHTLERSSLHLLHPRAEDNVIHWELSRASWVPKGGKESGPCNSSAPALEWTGPDCLSGPPYLSTILSPYLSIEKHPWELSFLLETFESPPSHRNPCLPLNCLFNHYAPHLLWPNHGCLPSLVSTWPGVAFYIPTDVYISGPFLLLKSHRSLSASSHYSPHIPFISFVALIIALFP